MVIYSENGFCIHNATNTNTQLTYKPFRNLLNLSTQVHSETSNEENRRLYRTERSTNIELTKSECNNTTSGKDESRGLTHPVNQQHDYYNKTQGLQLLQADAA